MRKLTQGSSGTQAAWSVTEQCVDLSSLALEPTAPQSVGRSVQQTGALLSAVMGTHFSGQAWGVSDDLLLPVSPLS